MKSKTAPGGANGRETPLAAPASAHVSDGLFYSQLLALATGNPEDHFFSQVHTALRARIHAPILVAATLDPLTREGFRIRYQRDVDDPSALPTIPQPIVAQSMRTGAPVLAGRFSDDLPNQTPDTGSSTIVAPIKLDGRSSGYLAVSSAMEGAFASRDVALVTAAADVSALIVRNVGLTEETRARSQELRLMLETARALASERDVGRLFHRLHRLIGGVLDASTFWVALGSWELGRMTIAYCVDHYQLLNIDEPLPLQGSLCGQVFREGVPLLMRTAEDWKPYPIVTQGSSDDVVSAVVVPMRIGARAIGVMSVQSQRPHAYSERDRDLMVAIAEQAAIAVENSQAVTRADKRAGELRLLAEVSRALTARITLKELCQTVCEEVRRVMEAPGFFVALRTDDDKLRMAFIIEGHTLLEIPDQPLQNSACERVVRTKQTLVLNTVDDIERQPHHVAGPVTSPIQSTAMAPLRVGDRCLGVISAQAYRENAYDDSSVRLLTAIAEQMALAVQNAQLFADAKQRADVDPLTNVYHHRFLKTRLEDELRRSQHSGKPVGLIMLDLDNFKNVNDTHGHLAGDEALKRVTKLLVESCRESDIIGRYGGDEFMVILPHTDHDQLEIVVARVENALASCDLPLSDSHRLPLRCSIGHAVYPQDAATPAELIARADAELYQAKRGGRSAARAQRVGTSVLKLEGDFEPVAELLAALVARDAAMRAHLEHVNRLAHEFAAALELNSSETNSLLLGATLHDVGKIALPHKVLSKPGGLSPAERDIVRQHPVLGTVLIEHIPGFRDAAVAVRHHHERFDGTGYPDRLKGKAIPLLARVVTLIDAFSAMVIDRPHHKGIAHAAAIRELRKGAGTQFDPELVERFAEIVQAGGGR